MKENQRTYIEAAMRLVIIRDGQLDGKRRSCVCVEGERRDGNK